MTSVLYRTVDVDGFDTFYREAGDRSKPALLLLHGFSTASRMFRWLIPLLADDLHIVAPDLPGFGLSALPARQDFTYSFDKLAKVVSRFMEMIDLDRYAIYIFDHGAPTGLCTAMARPDRVTAIGGAPRRDRRTASSRSGRAGQTVAEARNAVTVPNQAGMKR